MLHRFSIRQVILGALGTLGVVAFIGVAGLLVMATSMRRDLERQTAQLADDEAIAARIVLHVERQLDAVHAYAAGPDSALLTAFRQEGMAVHDQIRAYLFRALNSTERLLVERIREQHELIEVDAQRVFAARAAAPPGSDARIDGTLADRFDDGRLDAAGMRLQLGQLISLRRQAMLNMLRQQRTTWLWLYAVCALLGGAFLTALVLVTHFLQRRLLAPLQALSVAAARVGAGDFDARIETSRADELASFASSFNRMTERLRAAQLAEVQAEHRFRDLVEGVSTVMWEAEAHTLRCTYVSPQAEQMFGHSLADWHMETFWRRVMHPADYDGIVAESRAAMAQGRDHELVYRIVRADGSIVWIRDFVRVLLDETGSPARLRGVLTDITASRQAIDALRASEQRYHTLFDRVPVGLYRSTPDGHFLDANAATLQLLGFDARDDLLNEPLGRLYHDPEDRKRWQAALAAAPGVVEVDRQHRRRDGSSVWLRDIARAIRDDDGDIRYYEGALQDVTERVRAEEAVRRSEARFRSLIENASDGVLILDAAGRLQYQSPAIERMLGFAPAETIGTDAYALIHEEDRPYVRAAFAGLATPTDTHAVEFRARHRNGSWRLLHAIGTNLLDDPAVGGLVINMIDRTTHRDLEEQLQHAQKMEAVGRLAGGVAHDFNNLLTAIQGYADLLGDRVAADPHATGELAEIRRAAERAASLTRQLLAFSRRQIVRPRATQVDAVVGELDQMLRRLITEDTPLRTRVSGPCWVQIDAGQLEQVIMNLVVNARDAAPHHGIDVAVACLTIDEAPHARVTPGRYVSISVADDGCGIEPDVLPFIFEPFFTTKEVGRGTGLGLATVYGIVQQAGGDVLIESQPGTGTTVTVLLPAITAPAPLAAVAPQPPAAPGSETILLVEDEPAVRSLTERILQRNGYRVLSAANGIDALDMLVQSPAAIDLLVTDVVMPGMGGFALAERLLREQPDARVLFMSGYTAEALDTTDPLGRPLHLLEKPFSPATFATTIRAILDDCATAGRA